MSIIQCPECGWSISSKSLFCVRCGCCFADFEGLVKSLFVNELKDNKVSLPMKEIKTTINKVVEPPKQEVKVQAVNMPVELKEMVSYEIDNDKVVYTVLELMDIMGIGRNSAYDLVNSKQFPVKHIGKKMVVPIKPFNEWLEKSGGI